MKTIKILSATIAAVVIFSSCTREVYVDEYYYDEPGISLNELLDTYEVWYVDINQSTTNGSIPFMQIAFTLSFRNGVLYANNNLAGIGNTGNGFGIDVGYYDTYTTTLTLDHDVDGVYNFTVEQLANNKLRLRNYETNSSFILLGYQRANFDYDFVFYENIQYFLQEYEAWEKIYTSQEGMINEFDEENYLAFLPDGNGNTFLSSIDGNGLPPSQLYWYYEGIYEVLDVANNFYTKILTLDYDSLGNEYFELSVINSNTIELYHPYSGTTYRFKGRGYIEYLKPGKVKDANNESSSTGKLREKSNNRQFNAADFKSL